MISFKKYALLFCLVLLASTNALADDVTMKIVAANPLDIPKEKLEIRQDLPIELKVNDVVDTGGLNIAYDEQKSIYYVQTVADLGPNETREYKIKVHDVWKISKEELDFVLAQADTRLKSFEGKDTYTLAKTHRDRIAKFLDEINLSQESQIDNIDDRIESYRVNRQRLRDIRESVTLTDNFMREANRFADFEKDQKTINLTIESENPTIDAPLEKAEIIRYLPDGMRPDYLVDMKGFDLKYDNEKALFYLRKVEDFGPGEKKKFEISIADMWYIPDSRIDKFQKVAEGLSKKLIGSNYEKIATYITEEIAKLGEEVKTSQTNTSDPEKKIALYTVNFKKVKDITNKIEQLRNMLEEVEKAKSKKITEIVKSITPDVATTWKLIFGIIAFLAVISAFFFLLWWGQSKAKMGQKFDDLTPEESLKDKK